MKSSTSVDLSTCLAEDCEFNQERLEKTLFLNPGQFLDSPNHSLVQNLRKLFHICERIHHPNEGILHLWILDVICMEEHRLFPTAASGASWVHHKLVK